MNLGLIETTQKLALPIIVAKKNSPTLLRHLVALAWGTLGKHNCWKLHVVGTQVWQPPR